MAYDVAFVDSIVAAPTMRLNLHTTTGGWACLAEGTEFPPPAVARVVTESMQTYGGQVVSDTYRNRTLTLALELDPVLSSEAEATLVQALLRELDRDGNILRFRPDLTAPVFFKTFRSGPDAVIWDPAMPRRATVTLLAEPFAYGLEETVAAATVYNDPAEGQTLNLNPFFETNASDWTANGGTFVRSTAQFHEGVASGLLTPNGVATTVESYSGQIVILAGQVGRASAWLRCAVARSVSLNINWFTGIGGSYISTSNQTISVAANTWTFFDFDATAPATTGAATIVASMGSTPAAGHLLYVDEARIRIASGMTVNITGVKGDVETPLTLSFTNGTNGLGATGRIQSAIAIRRRGTVANVPFFLQAEAMTQGTDTTTQANSASFSGSGNNYSRCTFATLTSGQKRVYTATTFPSSPSVDARGQYRVYVRLRKNTSGDSIDVALQWGTTNNVIVGPVVRLANNTGIQLVDLGIMQIPTGFDPVVKRNGVELQTEGNYLEFYVRRNSGSGTLDMDYFLFVPADDRSMTILWPETQLFSTDVFVVEGGDESNAYCLSSTGTMRSVQTIETTGGGLFLQPNVTNRVFFIRDVGATTAAAGGGDVVTATHILTASYHPLYLAPLRPALT